MCEAITTTKRERKREKEKKRKRDKREKERERRERERKIKRERKKREKREKERKKRQTAFFQNSWELMNTHFRHMCEKQALISHMPKCAIQCMCVTVYVFLFSLVLF